MNLNLNLKDFLKYLYRFKWLIILVPLLSAGIAYYFVKQMPKKYASEALISTGITSQFQSSLNEGQSLDYFKLSQQFGNLLEMMKSRRVISMLSYQLILNDLKTPDQAFKKYSTLMESLSPTQKQTAIQEYEKRLASNALMSVKDNGAIKLFDILKSQGYDEESLIGGLSIARNGESDFVKIYFESPSPDLSTFVVNNMAGNFILYYTNLSTAGQKQSLAILDTVLRSKQTEMDRKNSALSNASASSAAAVAGSMTAQKRADMAYQQFAEAQAQKAQVVRTISALQGAIAAVDDKLRGGGGYLEPDAAGTENSEIVNLDNQLRLANQRYVNNNFNSADKAAIDSLQRIKSRLISRSAGRTKGNSASIKQALIDQKIKLENDLASAKSSMITIDQQLNSLKGAAGLVSAGGGIADNGTQQILARDADIASKEFTDAQLQFEKTMMATKAGVKLALVEPGLPGPPEKSKNILYVGFAGVSGLLILLLTLFISFATNVRPETPEQLESFTHQKVMGWLNLITEEDKDLRKIWKDDETVKEYSIYKEALRSLRFELNEQLKPGQHVLGITSIQAGEGKTFIAGSLSYAFAMMGKNVLLITEKDSSMMDLVSNRPKNQDANQKFESFMVRKEIQIEDRITILNRNAGNKSLLELRDNKSLEAGFLVLKDTFDVIIIDLGSLQNMHSVKEWLLFCDHFVGVYEAGMKMSEPHSDAIKYFSSQPGFLGWVLNKVRIKGNQLPSKIS